MRFVNLGFYERAIAWLPDAVEVVEARREVVAMAFNLASRDRLYGRYWGCVEDHPFLHFNVALYHSIDECIRRGTRVFEGGAGGEHKVARGFEPAETWSAHLHLDARLDAAVRRSSRRRRARPARGGAAGARSTRGSAGEAADRGTAPSLTPGVSRAPTRGRARAARPRRRGRRRGRASASSAARAWGPSAGPT